MKLATDLTNITSNINSEQKVCKISLTKKAFDVLSSGIYSNKIKAVVRELITNAYDSHVAAGKADVPVKVHLPTFIEPYFSVEDEGTGLSKEEFDTLYTTYFASNKDHTDDYIGGFGLGSKSPFAYVDQFLVTVIYKGLESSYILFWNEHSIPSYTLLSEIKTDKSNGLTVTVSVKPEDFEKFKSEFIKTFLFFNPRPIVNLDNIFPDIKYLAQGKDWGCIPNFPYKDIVVIGGVSYENINIFPKNILLFFKVGELEVSTSREQLINNDNNKCLIAYRSKIATTELQEQIKDKYENLGSIWEKLKFFSDNYFLIDSCFYKKESFQYEENECVYVFKRNQKVMLSSFKYFTGPIFLVDRPSNYIKTINKWMKDNSVSEVMAITCTEERIKEIGIPNYIKTSSIKLPREKRNKEIRYYEFSYNDKFSNVLYKTELFENYFTVYKNKDPKKFSFELNGPTYDTNILRSIKKAFGLIIYGVNSSTKKLIQPLSEEIKRHIQDNKDNILKIQRYKEIEKDVHRDYICEFTQDSELIKAFEVMNVWRKENDKAYHYIWNVLSPIFPLPVYEKEKDSEFLLIDKMRKKYPLLFKETDRELFRKYVEMIYVSCGNS